MLSSRRRNERPDGPFYMERGWISSAIFLAFLLVMALVAFMADSGNATLAAGSRDALAKVQGPLSPGDPQHVRNKRSGRPHNCRTNDDDSKVPTARPHDLRWRKLVAVMVPTLPDAGPTHVDPTMWWCFAHTPMGAILAAHIIPIEIGGPDWRTAVEQQVVSGKARDRLVARRIAVDTADPAQSAAGRFAGFSVRTYSAETADIRLLMTDPLGGYLSTSVSLRWREGDWKVSPQTDGSLYAAAVKTEPNGFVVWGG
ncbi:hypothetical protein [Streptomyces sp. NPDC017991]|uniref:hypothetical protein n=1 Tax=Streptomyces sp. NPDC017991 TaxID=3365026 RepID=UPI0037A7599E